jgi:ribonuclease-3 family protein
MNYDLLTGADLAFIGDAYFELYIRNYVLHKGYTKLNDLHTQSVKYVSRTSQSKIINALLSELTEEEISIFKRGRNFNYKNTDGEYVNASGFEALIGYLYLKQNKDRLEYLVSRSIEIIETKE